MTCPFFYKCINSLHSNETKKKEMRGIKRKNWKMTRMIIRNKAINALYKQGDAHNRSMVFNLFPLFLFLWKECWAVHWA